MSFKKSKNKSLALRRIGLWATIWWGVSCGYILLLVWLGRNNYAAISESTRSRGFFANWWTAISNTYRESDILLALLMLIIIIWIIGGWLWLQELKKQNISYQAAFKDLFLTIRK